jgi:hypothetical protein
MPVRSDEEHAIVCQRQGVTFVLATSMQATLYSGHIPGCWFILNASGMPLKGIFCPSQRSEWGGNPTHLSGGLENVCCGKPTLLYSTTSSAWARPPPDREQHPAYWGFLRHKPMVGALAHFAPSAEPPFGQKTDTSISFASQETASFD